MKVISNEKQEKSTVELVIEVGREEFEAAVEKVYKKQRGNIMVPGFRKGKAPRKIIEGMYGAGVFYEDAINELYPEAYAQAIEQEKLDVVGYPKVEVEKVDKDGFTFKAIVALKPPVKLGAYQGLTAVKETVKVTAADVEAEMKPYIDRATRLVSVERAAKMGDTAVIDFEGFLNGEPFEGGKGEGHELELGSGSFVPGFEEGVVGMKPGDEKDITLTFPEDYHADLAGKEVVFRVKLHEVKEHQAPKVDDEFAKDVSEFDTLEEFKADLSKKLTERREAAAQREFESALLEQVVENMEVEIPDAMVDVRVDEMVEDYARRISSQGIPFEQYMQMTGMTLDALRGEARPGALRQIQVDLALEAIVEAEKIEVSDEEVEAEYASLAEQYGMELDKVKAAVPADSVKRDLTMKKASQVVFSSAKAGKKSSKKSSAKEEEGQKKPAAKKTASKAKKAEGDETEKKPAAKKSTKKAAPKTEE